MFQPLHRSKKLACGLAAALAVMLGTSIDASAQISLTASSLTYAQDFNTFDGTAASASSELTGWTLSPNTYKGSDCGVATAGGIYAYGTAGDYALGYLPASSTPNDTFYAHVAFVNNTGGAISSVTISYNFERWRPNTRINGFTVVSDLGDVSALNQTGAGNTGTSCTVMSTPKTVTLSGLNVPNGATFYVEFRGGRGTGTGGSQGVAIDDFELSVTPLFAPTLDLGTLADFGIFCVGDTTTAQPLSVTGANLAGPVTVTAPAGFLLSNSAAGSFSNTLTLNPAGGNISEDIYVAFAPTAAGATSGNLTFSSTGMTDVQAAVSGTGNITEPMIGIVSLIDGPVCAGDVVTYVSNVMDGGTAPQITWFLNGVSTGITTDTFSVLLDSGDVVYAQLISNAPCAPDTAISSAHLTTPVYSIVTPAISIVATPSGIIEAGTTVTFNSTAGGILNSPEYIWLVNGDSVANGPAYITDSLSDGDVVQAILYTDAPCATNDSALSNQITIEVSTGINNVAAAGNFYVAPNPGNGLINLKGHITGAARTATLQLNNILGQQVYQASVPVVNGTLQQTLSLEQLPAGMYILSIETGTVRQHLRVEIRK